VLEVRDRGVCGCLVWGLELHGEPAGVVGVSLDGHLLVADGCGSTGNGLDGLRVDAVKLQIPRQLLVKESSAGFRPRGLDVLNDRGRAHHPLVALLHGHCSKVERCGLRGCVYQETKRPLIDLRARGAADNASQPRERLEDREPVTVPFYVAGFRHSHCAHMGGRFLERVTDEHTARGDPSHRVKEHTR